MDTLELIPSSSQTAECTPVVLRETQTTRLVFKPKLVRNPHDATACVNGVLVHQRKTPRGDWKDYNLLPLSKLKAGEWVKLELGAGEVATLVGHIAALYRHYRREGIPRRRIHLLKLELDGESLEDIRKVDMPRLLALSRRAGVDVVQQVLEWLAGVDQPAEVLDHLARLDVQSLQRLGALVGVSTIRNLLDIWAANETNKNEQFWQDLFERHAFVLSQAFAYPIVVIREKAYVGGKRLGNQGGNIVDFLATNPLTQGPVLIEIKTPSTKLLGRKYRDVFPASEELSGAISQVLSYRTHLLAEYHNLREGFEEQVDLLMPQCLVIAGHSKQLYDRDRTRSFEIIRGAYRDVTVITYDELFAKLQAILGLMTGNKPTKAIAPPRFAPRCDPKCHSNTNLIRQRRSAT